MSRASERDLEERRRSLISRADALVIQLDETIKHLTTMLVAGPDDGPSPPPEGNEQ